MLFFPIPSQAQNLRFPRYPVLIPRAPAIDSLTGRNHTDVVSSQPRPVAERESGHNSHVSTHQPCVTAVCPGSGRVKGSEPQFHLPQNQAGGITSTPFHGDTMEMVWENSAGLSVAWIRTISN